ncbi:MAG: hypothetical protein P4L45_00290, partial [Ignavibacteriaceae bacterium]|nr:hypothetical protein [Ignavibacteriaceae bacterium]
MRTILLFCITVLLCVNIYSKDNTVKNKQKLQKILSNDAVTYLDINNIFTPVYNNGKSSASLEYPKGSGNTAVYTEGILWGAFVANDPQVRVGGAEYSSGLQAGIIKPDGTADDPALAKYHAFRVRPDVYPGGPDVDLTQDAAYEHSDAATLRTQYEKDWNEWPANEGAPYTDVNKDGVYEPGTDIPGVPGADQTIWYVCNDMNSSLVNNLLGTAPLGIELQTTVWAYKLDGALNDTYFKKYKIINKGNQNYTFDSTFISLWVDTDLGSSTDDYCGSDSTLSLIYAYNGYPVDAVYSSPPTVGFYLIQGPVVSGKSGDTAFVGGRYVPGKKNLSMTASYFFISGSNGFGDPPFANVQGANQFYNFFNGEYGASGQPFQDPWGNKTKFVFPGDPVTG